jgi:thioesterase domain-containing protein/acyl carrier protein
MVPSRFVMLERLPLNPNGKVDVAALPVPPEPVRIGHVPPRTLMELRLAGIWEEILGVAPVGALDDFFELGGHSLLAVRLAGFVRERLGCEMPLATLLERPTLAALAEALEEGLEPGPYEPLVPLRATGERPPLFCVHAFGGGVMSYADLARELPPGQPFYGLQAPDRPGDPGPFDSIEEMASHYADSIRRVQPHGPYRIAGWSFGGRVALAIAHRLQELGERVGLLAVLDTRVDGDGRDAAEEPFDDADFLVQMLPAHLGVTVDDLRAVPDEARAEHVLALLRREGLLNGGIGLDRARRIREVWKAHARAVARYRPRPYDGSVVVLRAAEGPADRDPALGWRRLSTCVEVHEVPGNHLTMMVRPNVGILAGVLDAYLRRELERT